MCGADLSLCRGEMRSKEMMLEEKTELLHHYSIVIHEQARQFHTFIRDEAPSQVLSPSFLYSCCSLLLLLLLDPPPPPRSSSSSFIILILIFLYPPPLSSSLPPPRPLSSSSPIPLSLYPPPAVCSSSIDSQQKSIHKTPSEIGMILMPPDDQTR